MTIIPLHDSVLMSIIDRHKMYSFIKDETYVPECKLGKILLNRGKIDSVRQDSSWALDEDMQMMLVRQINFGTIGEEFIENGSTIIVYDLTISIEFDDFYMCDIESLWFNYRIGK